MSESTSEPTSDLTMDQVLDALDHAHQRATYGAVAAVLQRAARTLMKGRVRDQRHSWVVNSRTGEPTGYDSLELHPDLRERPEILTTKEDLLGWLTAAAASTNAEGESSYQS